MTKDAVLISRAGREDTDAVAPDFWTAADAPYLRGSAAANANDLFLSPSDFTAAEKRWVRSGLSDDARNRVRALIRYKLHAEGSLVAALTLEFTNGLHEQPRIEKFISATRDIPGRLADDVSTMTREQIGEVVRKADVLAG